MPSVPFEGLENKLLHYRLRRLFRLSRPFRLSRLFGVFGYFGLFGLFGESGRWVYWVCCVIASLSQLFKATLNVEHRTHLHIHASTHPAGSKELQDSSRNWSTGSSFRKLNLTNSERVDKILTGLDKGKTTCKKIRNYTKRKRK